MTRDFVEDFLRRRTHVRRYLALISKAERETRLGGGRQIDIDRLHVLRAGAFLILYNLIEASARAALQAIHDQMAESRVSFSELNLGIRREVVKGFRRNGNPDLHATMPDIDVDFVSASLDVAYHFSGSVDAKLLRAVASAYGFSSETDPNMTHGGKDLLTIKTLRNDLAHGDKTFDQVGRDFTIRDLLEISIRATSYISQILANVATYLDDEAYRSETDGPEVPVATAT